MMSEIAIGIDLGGTKIAAMALASDGQLIAERRVLTPRHDYDATLTTIKQLVDALERDTGTRGSVGVGMPGSISPASGRVQNANSVWLNGRCFDQDLAHLLERPVRCANDANCMALSEATDGAAAGVASVFGVILGTGCGGGIVINGQAVDGRMGIGGEWGHNPLPWMTASEFPGPQCWCGRRGCMETWVSGPGLAADHTTVTGEVLQGEEIVAAGLSGNAQARATLARHGERLARGLALVVNILDPDVIVLGGGLSRLPHLYADLPDLMAPHLFTDTPKVSIRPPKWGDASGARGAARLWHGAPR